MTSLEGGVIPHDLMVDTGGTGLISQAQTSSSQGISSENVAEYLQDPGGSIANPSLDGASSLAGHSEPEEGDAQERLRSFWERQMDEIQNMNTNEFKTQELPLARIKKIMKMDEDVKMISAEAPLLFSKAAQIFIHELSLRAWIHTEESKRRTLQRNDIATAITKFDQFDFLIDIVPREDLKPAKRSFNSGTSTDSAPYFYAVPQQNNAPAASNTAQTTVQAPSIQTGQLLIAQQSQNGQPLTLMPVNIDGTQVLQLAQQQQTVTQTPQQSQQASAVILNAAAAGNGGQLILQTQQNQQQQPQQQGIVQTTQVNEQKQQQQNIQAMLQQLIGNASNTGEMHTIQMNAQGQLQVVKVVNQQPQQAQSVAITPGAAGQQISANSQIFNLGSGIQVDTRQVTGANIQTMYVNAEE